MYRGRWSILCCLLGRSSGCAWALSRVMRPGTASATMSKTATGIWSRGAVPIPRFVDDLCEAQTLRLSSIPWILLTTAEAPAASWTTAHWSRTNPQDWLLPYAPGGLYHVLTRRDYQIADKSAGSEADTVTSLSKDAENELPKTREKKVNASIQETIFFIKFRCLAFFGAEVKMRWPSNSNWGLGSEDTWLDANSSDSSANFPDTIWRTNLAGIGENPGGPQRAVGELGRKSSGNCPVALFTPTMSYWNKGTGEDEPVEPRELAVKKGVTYAASWLLQVLRDILP